MIEAFLLTVFVGAIVLLMRYISQPLRHGNTKNLGIFAYSELEPENSIDIAKKVD